MAILQKKQKFTSPDKMIVRLQKRKIPHSIRMGSECTEIIVGTTCFTFTTTRNFPRRKLFLFNSVKRDVLKFMENGKLRLPPKNEVTKYNVNYDDSYGDICGTDLNHAYWRIAYIHGFISKKTYEHGLDPECKALRLATLSVLGREKSFKNFERTENDNGEVALVCVSEEITQKADPNLKIVFKFIRLYCYQMMQELSIKLGDDFECWKTDCIYYRNTPENVKMVHDYFQMKQMDFKHLDYFENENENKDNN